MRHTPVQQHIAAANPLGEEGDILIGLVQQYPVPLPLHQVP